MRLLNLFRENKPTIDNQNTSIVDYIPKSTEEYIENSTFYFSICTTKEEMKVLSALLLDENRLIKPFYKFHQEVERLYPHCNHDSLYQEHCFAFACANAYIRANMFTEDGDRYHWQLRKNGCEDITLTSNDPFWETFFPPNNWIDNEFFAIQVRQSKYPLSDSNEAFEYMSSNVDPLFQYNFVAHNTFPIDVFIERTRIHKLQNNT